MQIRALLNACLLLAQLQYKQLLQKEGDSKLSETMLESSPRINFSQEQLRGYYSVVYKARLVHSHAGVKPITGTGNHSGSFNKSWRVVAQKYRAQNDGEQQHKGCYQT